MKCTHYIYMYACTGPTANLSYTQLIKFLQNFYLIRERPMNKQRLKPLGVLLVLKRTAFWCSYMRSQVFQSWSFMYKENQHQLTKRNLKICVQLAKGYSKYCQQELSVEELQSGLLTSILFSSPPFQVPLSALMGGLQEQGFLHHPRGHNTFTSLK